MNTTITKELIQEIASGQTLYALVDVITKPNDCRFYSDALMHDQMLSGYGSVAESSHESQSADYIRRGGLTCYETCSSPEKRALYFDWARQAESHFRRLFAPAPNPLDLLKGQISGVWGMPVESEMWRGEPMASQVSRVVPDGQGILPHNDVLWVDQAGEEQVDPAMVSQLAINIYLKMPPQGGAVQLWGLTPSRPAYRALQQHGSYGLDMSRIGEPLVEVLPGVGQAVIFNSTMIHAVTPSIGGARCTLSCFMGYRGPNHPLTVWS